MIVPMPSRTMSAPKSRDTRIFVDGHEPGTRWSWDQRPHETSIATPKIDGKVAQLVRGKASSISPWKYLSFYLFGRPLYRTIQKGQVETRRSVAIQGTFFAPDHGQGLWKHQQVEQVGLGIDTFQHYRNTRCH